MPQTTAIAPDPTLLHNVRIWQGMGYPDRVIATAMVSPPLRTREQYEAYGLEWVDNARVWKTERKRRRSVSIETALNAVEAALARDERYTMEQLERDLHISRSTLADFRCNSPRLDAACERLINRNRAIGARAYNASCQQKISHDYNNVWRLLNEALAGDKPIAATDLSRQVGRSRSWIGQGVHKGNPEALKICRAIAKHNRRVIGRDFI